MCGKQCVTWPLQQCDTWLESCPSSAVLDQTPKQLAKLLNAGAQIILEFIFSYFYIYLIGDWIIVDFYF